jgi:hypothetical protein
MFFFQAIDGSYRFPFGQQNAPVTALNFPSVELESNYFCFFVSVFRFLIERSRLEGDIPIKILTVIEKSWGRF